MRNFVVLFGLTACAFICGCSSSWGTASGTVTVDGEPLKEGIITFHPVEGGATAYGQISEGSFTINTGNVKGLKTGSYDITVSASTIPEPGSSEQAKLLTPKKYSTKETTDLHRDVSWGNNPFKFDLKSDN